MSYTNAEGRQDLLDAVGDAADSLGVALAWLGEAYDRLDEHAADRLEDELFGPVQSAYGRARRTHAQFSERYGFPPRTFAPATAGHADGARAAVEKAMDAVRLADDRLGALQDTMLAVEVGDAEVRKGITDVRAAIGDLPGRARELVRTLGR